MLENAQTVGRLPKSITIHIHQMYAGKTLICDHVFLESDWPVKILNLVWLDPNTNIAECEHPI